MHAVRRCLQHLVAVEAHRRNVVREHRRIQLFAELGTNARRACRPGELVDERVVLGRHHRPHQPVKDRLVLRRSAGQLVRRCYHAGIG